MGEISINEYVIKTIQADGIKLEVKAYQSETLNLKLFSDGCFWWAHKYTRAPENQCLSICDALKNKYLSYLKVTNQRSCLNRNRICGSFPSNAQFWCQFFAFPENKIEWIFSLFAHVLKYIFSSMRISSFFSTVIYIIISWNATSNKFNMTYWCL